MPNVKQIIDGHNKATLVKKDQQQQGEIESNCNCRKKDECPLNGECLTKGVIYQAKVTTEEKRETYIGLAATDFKTRWRNHKTSFIKDYKKNDTELSKYIWELKGKEQDFSIDWKIVARAKPYSNGTKRCNLCTTEKYFILMKPFMASLNKRNEFISTCRHRRKYILKYNFP